MSDIKSQEQLRNDIGSALELSRLSWTLGREKKLQEDQEHEGEGFSPRSTLFRTLGKHPAISAATAASIWYFGPVKVGTLAVAGASLFMRYRTSVIPIAQHLLSSTLFKKKSKQRKV